jgi:hypothetical protein
MRRSIADYKEETVMSDLPAALKDGVTRQREPTKLECGLLGALCATIVLSVLFWISVQFSLVSLLVRVG